MDVALPGGDWAELLGHYTISSVDLLVPAFMPSFGSQLTAAVAEAMTSLANYTANTSTSVARCTNYIARYSAALLQQLVAVRARGFYAQEEVFIATVALGAKLQVGTFDVEDTSPLLWSWTASCLPVHYARERVLPNVLRLSRSATTTSPLPEFLDRSLRTALAADIEGRRTDLLLTKPMGFGRLTHPFKWDTFADDAAFASWVAKASKFRCEWSGIREVPMAWVALLANESLGITSCDAEALALACENAA